MVIYFVDPTLLEEGSVYCFGIVIGHFSLFGCSGNRVPLLMDESDELLPLLVCHLHILSDH